ncbi:unnamed protein product [Auanema sp. JU1783]|nr:unnamed protein product [Auanema sp. JU1783]
MNQSDEEKEQLLKKLDEFHAGNHSSERDDFDHKVFRSLFKQFLTEDAHIDWNSWKFISEDVQKNLKDLPSYTDEYKSLLDRLVVIKLNGGLGTTMGCSGPKSLIEVKDGKTFLDIAINQQELFNKKYECHVPLYLMNSFYTEEATKEKLPAWVRTFVQSKCPRIDAESLLPLEEEFGENKWYPPGHGNIFASLSFSGILDELIAEGRDIMFVSNIDNTGACLNLSIARWFADVKADYLMECTKKTELDIKGGTLIDINGQLMHLEIPQVPPEHLDEFCSTKTFKIFNTNNIWVNLRSVKQQLESIKSEIIVNKKNVQGRNVIQLETSIGGCIRNFPKAYCVHVERNRFIPVKKTEDLLAIRTSLYGFESDGTPKLERDQ